MKRHRCAVLGAMFAVVGSAADVEVPPGVVYKRSSAEINDGGVAFIKRLLDPADPVRRTSAYGLLICCPGLWRDAEAACTTGAPGAIRTEMVVPNTTTGEQRRLAAATWTSAQPLPAILAATLDVQLAGRQVVVRKLTKAELEVHWAIISWDIEEPIFVVEAGDKRYLVDLQYDNQSYTVAVVDDLTAYTIPRATPKPLP